MTERMSDAEVQQLKADHEDVELSPAFIERMKEILWDDLQPDLLRLIALAESFVAIEEHKLDICPRGGWIVSSFEKRVNIIDADLSTAIRQCIAMIKDS